jgi:hypothetical protein
MACGCWLIHERHLVNRKDRAGLQQPLAITKRLINRSCEHQPLHRHGRWEAFPDLVQKNLASLLRAEGMGWKVGFV